MYDETLFQQRMQELGLNPTRISRLAGITNKTAQSTVYGTRSATPESIYRVAKALQFPVKKKGDRYDFTAIMKKKTA